MSSAKDRIRRARTLLHVAEAAEQAAVAQMTQCRARASAAHAQVRAAAARLAAVNDQPSDGTAGDLVARQALGSALAAAVAQARQAAAAADERVEEALSLVTARRTEREGRARLLQRRMDEAREAVQRADEADAADVAARTSFS